MTLVVTANDAVAVGGRSRRRGRLAQQMRSGSRRHSSRPAAVAVMCGVAAVVAVVVREAALVTVVVSVVVHSERRTSCSNRGDAHKEHPQNIISVMHCGTREVHKDVSYPIFVSSFEAWQLRNHLTNNGRYGPWP